MVAALDCCYCCYDLMGVDYVSPGGKRLWGAQDLLRMTCEKTWKLMDESGLTGPHPPALDD